MSPLLHWKRISCSIVKGAKAAFDTFTRYSAEFETMFICALGDEKMGRLWKDSGVDGGGGM